MSENPENQSDIINLQQKKNKFTRNNTFSCLGTSTHTENERQAEDYYATDPKAAELLLQIETFSNDIIECACGGGHVSKVLLSAGKKVRSIDMYDRGFGETGIDFLGPEITEWSGDVITNPPFKNAEKFIEKALSIVPDGNKVAMFLKLQFLEGKRRKKLFQENPPKTVWVSSSRLMCAINGDFQKLENSGGSAIAYAWYVWVKGYRGTTELKWFN